MSGSKGRRGPRLHRTTPTPMTAAEIAAYNTGSRMAALDDDAVSALAGERIVPSEWMTLDERDTLARLGEDAWWHWWWKGWTEQQQREDDRA